MALAAGTLGVYGMRELEGPSPTAWLAATNLGEAVIALR